MKETGCQGRGQVLSLALASSELAFKVSWPPGLCPSSPFPHLSCHPGLFLCSTNVHTPPRVSPH